MAYRPFDQTDAAVAPHGDLELELGPLEYLDAAAQRSLIVPALVLNFGALPGVEIVLEGRQQLLLDDGGEARWRVTDTALSIKDVLRPGVLQEASGPSVAIEGALLLPTVHDEVRGGASAVLIVSLGVGPLLLHVNGGLALTRATAFGLGGGAIVEGPTVWPVRPVAELLYEWDTTDTSLWSGVVGAIWEASDALAIDVGLRLARADEENELEVRAGLTWDWPLWRPSEAPPEKPPRPPSEVHPPPNPPPP